MFGTVDWNIVENLTLTLGGNYTHDSKTYSTKVVTTDVFSGLDLVRAGVNAGVPAVVAANPQFNPFLGLRGLQFIPPYLNVPNGVEDGRTSDSDFAYTARLNYKFNDNLNIYATHATGFKASSINLSFDARPPAALFIPGSTAQSPAPAASPIRTALGANLPVNLTTGSRSADPEYATVYELGIKGQWEGFGFNLAAFRQTLNGFQSNVFSGTGFILANAEQQSVTGFELDTTISPVKDLRFFANLTYLNMKFDSFVGGAALQAGSFSTLPQDLSGLRVAGVPEFAVSVGGDYTARLNDNAKLNFHVDFQHESPTQIAQGTVALRRTVDNLNAAATLVLNNKLDITVWGSQPDQRSLGDHHIPGCGAGRHAVGLSQPAAHVRRPGALPLLISSLIKPNWGRSRWPRPLLFDPLANFFRRRLKTARESVGTCGVGLRAGQHHAARPAIGMELSVRHGDGGDLRLRVLEQSAVCGRRLADLLLPGPGARPVDVAAGTGRCRPSGRAALAGDGLAGGADQRRDRQRGAGDAVGANRCRCARD